LEYSFFAAISGESRMSNFVLNINGADIRVSAPSEESLLSVLRNRLNLTGTKYGCGEGQCGACTVLIDGRAVRSCLVQASTVVSGQKITTIEGLEQNGKLSPMQQAFLEEEAFQCGYCTSGMIVAATALLRTKANPSEEEIVQQMNHNVCRCGTYPRIVQAIRRVSQGSATGGSR
jgi:aerobic-type carbon monoxide dehydrogenase small subunit (CoxS/CutS family)